MGHEEILALAMTTRGWVQRTLLGLRSSYVTGILEWTSAVLIAVPFTRLAGCLLAAAVMAAAAVTVLLNGEYSHAVAPLIVLCLVCLNGWLTWRAQHRRY